MTTVTTVVDSLVNVRFYTPQDIYYYTIDNRPLTDLSTNVTTVANYVDLLMQNGTGGGGSGAGIPYVVDTSINANVITVSTATPLSSASSGTIPNGQLLEIRPANGNTGPTNLNVNGIGAYSIVSAFGALQGGEFIAGRHYIVSWEQSSTQWLLIASGGGALPVAPGTQSGQAINLGQTNDGSLSPTFGSLTTNSNITCPAAVSGTQAPNLSQVNNLISAALTPENLRGGFEGTYTASQVVFQYTPTTILSFPQGLIGSYCTSLTAAGSNDIFSVTVNGVHVGSLTFTQGSNLGYFSASSSFYVNPGQILAVTAPSTTDANLTGLAFTLVGNQVTLTSASGTEPYYLTGGFQGSGTNAQVLLQYISAEYITIPDGFLGSYAYATTSAAAQTVFNVELGGSNIGTITFAANSNLGFFSASSATNVSPGQVLTILGPTTADARLGNLSITLVGVANSTSGQDHYDLLGGFSGAETASELALSYASVRTVEFPSNFSGSQATATTAPSATTTLTLDVNGTSVGTVSFAANSTSATFSGSALTVTPGQLVTLTGPSSTYGLAGVSVTLAGSVPSSGSTYPGDLQAGFVGVGVGNQRILQFPCPDTLQYPSGLTGSEGIAGTAATGSTTFTIFINGVSVGSLNFAAGATTATFSSNGFTVYQGQVLTIRGPSTADTTLANVSITLSGSIL
jgi:hypothetical protein